MELRLYWRVLWRRWWLVATVTVLAGVASFFLSPRVQTSYVATTRMVVSLPPERSTMPYLTPPQLAAFQSAEFLVDDFSEVVKSQAFAQDVLAELKDPTITIGSIHGSQSTEKTHRVLALRITATDPQQAVRIAEAAARVLQTKAKEYFAQLGAEEAQVRVIDLPTVVPQSSAPRAFLDWALRTALGLLAGLGLVFLLHYLDTTLYDAQEVESLLGVAVLGEIPRYKGRGHARLP